MTAMPPTGATQEGASTAPYMRSPSLSRISAMVENGMSKGKSIAVGEEATRGLATTGRMEGATVNADADGAIMVARDSIMILFEVSCERRGASQVETFAESTAEGRGGSDKRNGLASGAFSAHPEAGAEADYNTQPVPSSRVSPSIEREPATTQRRALARVARRDLHVDGDCGRRDIGFTFAAL